MVIRHASLLRYAYSACLVSICKKKNTFISYISYILIIKREYDMKSLSSVSCKNVLRSSTAHFNSKKAKQSRYTPGGTQRVPGNKVPRFRDNGTRWW